jgi:hypothetical protein
MISSIHMVETSSKDSIETA